MLSVPDFVNPMRRPNVFVLVHLYQLLFFSRLMSVLIETSMKTKAYQAVPFSPSNPALVGSLYPSQINHGGNAEDFQGNAEISGLLSNLDGSAPGSPRPERRAAGNLDNQTIPSGQTARPH